MKRGLVLLAVCLAFACDEEGAAGEEEETAADESTAERARGTAKGTGDRSAEPPGSETDDPDPALDEVAAALEGEDGPAAPSKGEVPEGGCAEVAARAAVWPRPGPAAVAAHGDAFVVAGYAPGANGGEELFVARAAPGESATPLTRVSVEPGRGGRRSAAPGLLVDEERAWIARIDAGGHLGLARIALAQPGAPLRFIVLAEGADLRFRPALARRGDFLAVAWVDGRATPMRVRVTRVDARTGEPGSTHDATLEAMGAAAPTFVAGASPPVLVFVDPRSGISPLVRVPIGPDGTPRTGRVAVSVGQVAEPPDVAAAVTADGTAVGYTAIGSGATTAVGLVRLHRPTAPPVALVKGTGYGSLGVAATDLPGAAALFAAEAPTARAKGADRVLHLRLVGGKTAPGPVLELKAEGASLRHPALARRADGTAAVAFTDGEAVRTTFVRCRP